MMLYIGSTCWFLESVHQPGRRTGLIARDWPRKRHLSSMKSFIFLYLMDRACVAGNFTGNWRPNGDGTIRRTYFTVILQKGKPLLTGVTKATQISGHGPFPRP